MEMGYLRKSAKLSRLDRIRNDEIRRWVVKKQHQRENEEIEMVGTCNANGRR
jgi:hypothetical protein